MPSRTGLSHAAAAVVVVIISPVIKRLLELLLSTRDIATIMNSLGELVSGHPFVPLEGNLATTVLYILVVAALAFIWGYAYHVKRHS